VSSVGSPAEPAAQGPPARQRSDQDRQDGAPRVGEHRRRCGARARSRAGTGGRVSSPCTGGTSWSRGSSSHASVPISTRPVAARVDADGPPEPGADHDCTAGSQPHAPPSPSTGRGRSPGRGRLTTPRSRPGRHGSAAEPVARSIVRGARRGPPRRHAQQHARWGAGGPPPRGPRRRTSGRGCAWRAARVRPPPAGVRCWRDRRRSGPGSVVTARRPVHQHDELAGAPDGPGVLVRERPRRDGRRRTPRAGCGGTCTARRPRRSGDGRAHVGAVQAAQRAPGGRVCIRSSRSRAAVPLLPARTVARAPPGHADRGTRRTAGGDGISRRGRAAHRAARPERPLAGAATRVRR
jgi:hypothetical protein